MKADGTKKKIIRASEQLFIEKGYNALSMSDIVNASGYSRGGVYRYYGSVKEVFEALIEENTNIIKNKKYESYNEYLNDIIYEIKNIDKTTRLAGYEYMISNKTESKIAQEIYDVNIDLISKTKECTIEEAQEIFLIIEGLIVMSLSNILEDDLLMKTIEKLR